MEITHNLIAPSPHLRAFVKDYRLFDFTCGRNEAIPVKPFPATNEQCLVFYLRGNVTAVNKLSCKQSVFAKIALNGSQISRFDFHMSSSFRFLSVAFQPGALARFLRLPLPEFTDERIDAEAVLGSQINRLHEKLSTAASNAAVIALFEAWLWKRLTWRNIQLQPFDAVALLLAQNSSTHSIQKLASEACLSISQFERRFVKEVGITPKLFVRINRFEQAIRLKEKHPQYDWLRVAVETGYYDYQHLVKDFRQFSATTPHSHLLEQANAPEKLISLLKNKS